MGFRYPQAYVSQGPTAFHASLPITTQTTYGGVSLDSGQANLLAALMVLAVTANGLIATPRWQVQNAAGTWIDVTSGANPAFVAFATGTGTIVTTSRYFVPPDGLVAGSRPVRFAIVTSGASGAGGVADLLTIDYDFRGPSTTFGV